jgi:hypothetical protein
MSGWDLSQTFFPNTLRLTNQVSHWSIENNHSRVSYSTCSVDGRVYEPIDNVLGAGECWIVIESVNMSSTDKLLAQVRMYSDIRISDKDTSIHHETWHILSGMSRHHRADTWKQWFSGIPCKLQITCCRSRCLPIDGYWVWKSGCEGCKWPPSGKVIELWSSSLKYGKQKKR